MNGGIEWISRWCQSSIWQHDKRNECYKTAPHQFITNNFDKDISKDIKICILFTLEKWSQDILYFLLCIGCMFCYVLDHVVTCLPENFQLLIPPKELLSTVNTFEYILSYRRTLFSLFKSIVIFETLCGKYLYLYVLRYKSMLTNLWIAILFWSKYFTKRMEKLCRNKLDQFIMISRCLRDCVSCS